MNRRDALKVIAAAGAGVAGAACTRKTDQEQKVSAQASPKTIQPTEGANPILSVQPLGFPWQTLDPFLFCVHHDDKYPAGNDKLGPAASLEGRDMGQDFAGKDGWRMYHGREVPGFPYHPHRGFETVTIVRRGLCDHSDSLGAAARFGGGDVQWLTAGKGILHSEMFPLLRKDRDNPLELFQIWLNLPRADKFVEPYFSMFWNETIRRYGEPGVEVAVIAGSVGEVGAQKPPPNSWAARDESDVAIWTIKLAPQTSWNVPAAKPGTNRMLYYFSGNGLRIAGQDVPLSRAVRVRPDAEVALQTGDEEVELLLLQGRPIGEPVVQYGPFVMNTREEIVQAFNDYQRTQFGGWRWPSDAPTHGREEGRFARHADGKTERPA